MVYGPLFVSSIKMAVAATAWMHAGHPLATESNSLEIYAIGFLHPPHSWATIPYAMPFSVFTNKLNSFLKSGKLKTGALDNLFFILLTFPDLH